MTDPLQAARFLPCITGMGVISPIGSDLPSFWDGLLAGRQGAGTVQSFETSALDRHVGCEIGDFKLAEALRPYLRGGRCSALALAAADQAVEDAGLRQEIDGAPDVGVVVGTTMGDVHRFEADRLAHPERPADDSELASLAHRPLEVMGLSIAGLYHLSHPVTTVPAACAAGSYAVGMAAAMVARGDVRMALAVGCEAFSRLAFLGFLRLGAMSPDRCRPFSRDRPGLLLGEGAAALVLESSSSARRRGARIHGVVEGFGLSCDAYHVTGPHPDGAGAARAMQKALQRAGVAADEVDYINAHGTGTALNDSTECKAIRRVFGDAATRPPVSSIKALTGHMMGAAGAVEAVASLLALQHEVIPPTWNWEDADPECDVDCVADGPRPAPLRRVLSNSYAFGGYNASLLFTPPPDGKGQAG